MRHVASDVSQSLVKRDVFYFKYFARIFIWRMWIDNYSEI